MTFVIPSIKMVFVEEDNRLNNKLTDIKICW